MSSARDFLSKEQQEAILHAIELAEHQTSGEIRVHIESTCKSDPYERAQKVFLKLKMNKTAQRNGILFGFMFVTDIIDNFFYHCKSLPQFHFKHRLTFAISVKGDP